ncbi:MAG: SIS domain-containing protein [Opitutaceae bacterium]
MKTWLSDYVSAQKAALDSISPLEVENAVNLLREAHTHDRQIFVIGNGGSAANASHFATDLGKGSSDALGKRFRVMSLTDNTPWITALGNDDDYADIFRRQLENFARPGDLVLAMSVSGNSPNLVKATEWANLHQLTTIALVSALPGKLSTIAQHVIAVNDTHFGRVEDAHMGICHMLAYAFMEVKTPDDS